MSPPYTMDSSKVARLLFRCFMIRKKMRKRRLKTCQGLRLTLAIVLLTNMAVDSQFRRSVGEFKSN